MIFGLYIHQELFTPRRFLDIAMRATNTKRSDFWLFPIPILFQNSPLKDDMMNMTLSRPLQPPLDTISFKSMITNFVSFSLKEFACLLYKSHLEEIKNLQQQDILHILFSKAIHCSAIKVIYSTALGRF